MSQTYPYIEHIIIDGTSTDNTLEILKAYGNRIQWLSESDRGQADAVNKGFRMAKGEILGWLNSDDTYEPDAVRTAVDHFATNPEVVMLYAEAYNVDKCGRFIDAYPSEAFSMKRLRHTCFISQPTVFLRREVLDSVGILDDTLQTCMDYEFWIRIGLRYHPRQISFLKGIHTANSRIYSSNKTFGRRRLVYREVMRTQKKYFGRPSPLWIWGYVKEFILGAVFPSLRRF